MIHRGDVVVLAVEAGKLDGHAMDFVLSFAHVLAIGSLQQDHVLAVRFLQIENGHSVHIVDMAVEVGHGVVVIDALADGNHGDNDEESDDETSLMISDVGSLRWSVSSKGCECICSSYRMPNAEDEASKPRTEERHEELGVVELHNCNPEVSEDSAVECL